MESLLRLSGLLSEDDDGATDLGTLEKKLADRTKEKEKERANSNASTPGLTNEGSESSGGTPRQAPQSPNSDEDSADTPNSARNEEEVEALSDMMCSLVTNNCGETRYIGMNHTYVAVSAQYC